MGRDPTPVEMLVAVSYGLHNEIRVLKDQHKAVVVSSNLRVGAASLVFDPVGMVEDDLAAKAVRYCQTTRHPPLSPFRAVTVISYYQGRTGRRVP